MAQDVPSFNRRIIEEFRANQGIVGAPFAGVPLLLLGTIGAKSGTARVNPLAFTTDGEDLIIIASFSGADQHPPWYFNLKANSEVTVEVGSETYQASAQILGEPDRTRLYTQMEAQMSTFTDYREKTDRVIPVVSLQRI
jgi:deazaflavin-dependent oxidoreductase (nitroreductase family)